MNKNKNRQPDAEKRPGGPNQNKSERKHRLNEPTAQTPDKGNQPQETPQRESEPSGEWTRPITNQDEQRKTTNVQNNEDAVGEDEKEGDQHHERIKPYKNIGDDSEEVEKKTPTS